MPEKPETPGTVTWVTAVKPLLESSYCAASRSAVTDLVEGIVSASLHFSQHDPQHETWFQSYAVLASDFIANYGDSLSQSHQLVAAQAVKILAQYLCRRIQELVHVEPLNASLAEDVTWGIVVAAGGGVLSQATRAAHAQVLKQSPAPPHVKQSDCETPDSDFFGSPDSPSYAAELMRPQTDLTGCLLEQLTSPIGESGNAPADCGARWINQLRALDAGEVLLELVHNLPQLKQFIQKWREATTGEGCLLPASHSEANQLRAILPQLANDVELASRLLQLPLLQPLELDRLTKLTEAGMGCLLAAVAVTTAQSIAGLGGGIQDDNLSVHARLVVERSLELTGGIVLAARSSTRLGAAASMNLTACSAWLLVTGLHTMLSNTSQVAIKGVTQGQGGVIPKRGVGQRSEEASVPETAPARINLAMIQQGYSVLSVALASHALTLTSSLLADLDGDGGSVAGATQGKVEPATFDLGGSFSGVQRVALVLDSVPLYQLLLQLATVSYRKANAMNSANLIEKSSDKEISNGAKQKEKLHIPDLKPPLAKYEPELEDENLDDEEPILGHWMRDILCPPSEASAPCESTEEVKPDDCMEGICGTGVGEPAAYLQLAGQLVSWLATRLGSLEGGWIGNYTRASIGESMVTALSTLIREVDTDISSNLPNQLQPLWAEFSDSLSSLTHNMVSGGINGGISDHLSGILLSGLGLDPSADKTSPWPLNVKPRSLAVLAQILLVRQRHDSDTYSMKTTTQYVSIWERIITSMCNAAISKEPQKDINIENLQLMLLIFHALQLMQKKQVLLHTASCLMTVCQRKPDNPSSQYCLILTRMSLMVEYLVRHLYEPPPTLLTQIQENLFRRSHGRPTFCAVPEIEDQYEEPRYYQLSPNAHSFNLEVPKLDGLAVSFILGTPESLDYSGLYESLVDCLDCLNFGNDEEKGKPAHYCFLVLWRLVKSLPPPAPLLAKLVAMAERKQTAERPGYGLILLTLILGPRCNHKNFSSWIKDCLVKQSLTMAKAEALVKSVAYEVNSIGFDVQLIKSYLASLEEKGLLLKDASFTEPRVSDLMLLDCLMAKLQISLDKTFNSGKTSGSLSGTDACLEQLKGGEWGASLPQAVEAAQHLVPSIAMMVHHFSLAARTLVLNKFKKNVEEESSGRDVESATYTTLLHSLCLAGTRCPSTASLALPVTAHLSPALRSALEAWAGASITSFPPASAWRNQFSSDPIPGESYISGIISSQAILLNGETSCPYPSLKHVLFSAARFACDLIIWCPEAGMLQQKLINCLFPLLLDATTENLADLVTLSLERLVGTGETDKFLASIYQLVIKHSYPILVGRASTQPYHASHHIPQEIVRFMDTMLDRPVGRVALHYFFTAEKNKGSHKLTEILMSLAAPDLSPDYASRVLRMFNKLFTVADRHKEEKASGELCQLLAELSNIPSARLESWLRYLVAGMFQFGTNGEEDTLHENRVLLQSLTGHIVKDSQRVPEAVPAAILTHLIPLASELLAPSAGPAVGFPDLMAVMSGLAGAGGGKGHIALFTAATQWMEIAKQFMIQKNVVEKMELGVMTGRHGVMLENIIHLLNYISDIVMALRYGGGRWGIPLRIDRPVSPIEGDIPDDISWTDEIAGDDDDSGGEDSDDEALDGKLCTYTQTAKVFMNQHWYHCHTCGMVDGVGCCSICARVCHRDHDVTYSKHGSFFCDCGAKEDGSCTALTPRIPLLTEDNKRRSVFSNGFESTRRRVASPAREAENEKQESITDAHIDLARQIDEHRTVLIEQLSNSGVVASLLELSQALAPVLESSGKASAAFGTMSRMKTALESLHSSEKIEDVSEHLVLPTLGSQEGAFENVRMNYSGEQGQTIRQLLNAHMIRRGIMCCLSSPFGRRQHLAVAHEKGKITVLQLSALLKQADSSQKKLTLTRLASAPVPFTVLSLVSNPCNENFLVVCGLKDCHVLTFNSSGGVSDQLVLQPQLEAANYIIKPVWLPGSQTQLAVVTADSVKIYDLSLDVLSPSYYFLIPSGKIRDATFVYTDSGSFYLLLMSSAGHIYFQQLCNESSAIHGPFYVTNIMDVCHPEVRDSGGSLAGGGVSIYYSHTLKILCISYAQGKSFMAPLTTVTEELRTVFQIQMSNHSSGKNNSPQALCGWGEIPGHPGLITAVLQLAGNPFILMVEPEKLTAQEIKVGTKSKIMDMVAIRHAATSSSAVAGEQRTTMILLCEDGSLKIYTAGIDTTGYWLSPNLQQTSVMATTRPTRRKKTTKVLRASGHVSFPLDFFEHCHQQTSDIEFGGIDILQVYNVAQVKQRLQTTGLYIANTKPGGFQIEITNSDTNSVIVALRILLGSQDATRVPSSIEINGRTCPITVTRPRWFEIPLTREESIQCGSKLNVNFGASMDPGGVNMVDNIQVWVKSKESFGWPEDTEEFSTNGGVSSSATAESEEGVSPSQPVPLSPVDKVIVATLETLDAAFAVCDPTKVFEPLSGVALTVATRLLVATGSGPVQKSTRSLMIALHPSRSACHAHTDTALLKHASDVLVTPSAVDVESFLHLVATARTIAVSRPANLVRFAETHEAKGSDAAYLEDQVGSPNKAVRFRSEECKRFMDLLAEAFWRLLNEIPPNSAAGALGQPGLIHIEATVQSLVEIFHAFTLIDIDTTNLAATHYIKFLLCKDPRVAFPARSALVRAIRPRPRKRRILPTPPGHVATPRDTPEARPAAPAPPHRDSPLLPRGPPGFRPEEYDEAAEAAALNLGPGGIPLGGVAGNLDALLPIGGGGLPAMLDLPPDVDDEAMVELAIALSLQDQGEGGAAGEIAALQQGLQGLHHLANLGQGLAGILGGARQPEEQESDADEGEDEEVGQQVEEDAGHYSDTTASAPGSDDDGSLAGDEAGETGGDAEGGESGGGGSDSGGSVGESIGVENITVSGRSSTYEMDNGSSEINNQQQREDAGNEHDIENDTDSRLRGLRLILLERLISSIGDIQEVGGAQCIPYTQLILAVATDLDHADERDRAAIDALLKRLVKELGVGDEIVQGRICSERSPSREFQLVILRLLSVLMSRSRSPQGSKAVSQEASKFVSKTTASMLAQSGTVAHCLSILKNILSYWRGLPLDEGAVVPGCKLLKPSPPFPPPDMAPFFLKQYVKSHANDVFEAYPQLLTEMALRIPYQMKKIAESGAGPVPHFDQDWNNQLCELMMTPQAPFVKRQVRKLLLLLCGSKEQYRQLRDLHTLETRIKEVKIIVAKGGFDFTETDGGCVNLLYDTLIQLIEQLKSCVEVAESRTLNWQRFCMSDETVLPFLLQVSYLLDDGVSQFVLQLLQSALCPSTKNADKSSRSKSSSPAKAVRKDKSKSEEPDDGECGSDESLCIALVQQLCKSISPKSNNQPQPGVSLLARFIEKFLLECNTTAARWQAHALVVSLHKYAAATERTYLLSIMWALWARLPDHGRRAAQFVDLLGFFSVEECKEGNPNSMPIFYASEAVSMLRSQNAILASHPNSAIYTVLGQLVDFTGYYLESDPCLVCNNPEVSFSNLKLSSLKVDTKYTTSTQMVKLSGSHSISKILLRIGDLKRQKMVRIINIYYNNRTVQAVVELKNRPTMWHLAKRVTLTAGQTDLKVEFPLPIVACNIMVEYSDFYENIQAVGESLQCPRCSASVPANPGVCSNCGENVFQCHKCRAINYDEKDPFLCNSCGFCKYAKFEYTLTARPCCAVDPIENEEDRKKALTSINSLLEKADKVYRQLISNKPQLEQLLVKIQDGCETGDEGSAATGSPVNRSIHLLGQKYCVECKNAFEELSKLIQRVMATRLELLAHDKSIRAAGGTHEAAATPQVERKLSSGLGSLRPGSGGGRCYGCAAACVEHCLTLLRALATRQVTRAELHRQELVGQLLDHNLRRGLASTRSAVRDLICLLTRNNSQATDKLNVLLFNRLSQAITGGEQMLAPVRHEMTLLAATVQQQDQCWEGRLRTVVKLFLMAAAKGNCPAVMDSITLPCLNILHKQLKVPQAAPAPPAKKEKGKEKTKSLESDHMEDVVYPAIDVQSWLSGDLNFSMWQTDLQNLDQRVLIRKYLYRWKSVAANKKWIRENASWTTDQSYLKQILFNRSCRSARQVAANLVQNFVGSGPPERRKNIIDTLTGFLAEVGEAGEASEEFMELYKKLVLGGDWCYYLAVKGVLQHLATLIEKEIEQFSRLEQTRLSSDLALGYAVKQLTSLLASLLQHGSIKAAFKSRLVSAVLGGYLSLRRLVVQRTKMVDETQDNLLELLEDLTTGTEEETRAFMAVCVETVQRYPPDDHLTPVFIFERLCSIILPEEADTGEFFLSLEKDPQQEEFLQGRMLGNPYSSKDSNLGPLMREVKNKICTDCELVALLEDDNGMELLVNNKIISLDLPVKDVYNKVWLPEAGEGEAMRVVYRMRGLLGDATEEFIESLDKKEGEAEDDEVTYRLAKVMGQCGGLKVLLSRLVSVTSLANKTLLAVLLKLLGYCCKLRSNRSLMLEPGLGTTRILLGTLQLCLASGEQQHQSSTTETVLDLMEKLLVEAAASHDSVESYRAFASASATDINNLLEHAVRLKPGTDLHQGLMRVLPFLTYANRDNMTLVINHFNDVIDFKKFDLGHNAEDEANLEAWVALCDGIERNELGNTMKDELVRLGIVARCTDYIKQHSPPTTQVLLRTDDPAWKEFSMKPSVKYILRGLAGLAKDHPATQTALANTVIAPLHLMEQMSSDEHLGSLAEAVLEALKGHPEAAAKVKQARTATRQEKKKLAMAMRAKQLKAIGLKTNDKGQVKAESANLEQYQAIGEESGLSCVICREGYKFQPGKVLAVYTFTRRCVLEDHEKTTRKTMGFTTVSHFNLVHVDCHLAAVRQARARDEWESALLQNANTKCNGLLPLWGPGVSESAFASCLARHNTYLAEATGQRDISYQATVHDMKHLLLKFSQEKSFSEDCGGGGPQSNLHLLPYLAHMALYVINTTRAGPREIRQLNSWVSLAVSEWVEQCYAVDGPTYQVTLALLLLSPQQWKKKRVAIFQRLLLAAHVQSCSQGEALVCAVKEYSVYRTKVLLFALVDRIITVMWDGVPGQDGDPADWPTALADWIRTNDETILARSTQILTTFQNDLVAAQDMGEVIDVCGLLEEVPSGARAVLEVLNAVTP